MSYLPLARKYRPQTFADLVGQEDTATAIANSIRIGREAHAVIFSGVRGIGKTTTARLYAKALNCDEGPTPEPCNVCESCKAIVAGHHEDVMEIDGASNTGVEDVRVLKETVTYAPQRSKFKVYIIDEVHMLSQSAFNALLKTLEEPPPQVVFLFATTELHKVPQTILSRCQTFHLNKFRPADIVGRLGYILGQESIEFEDRALQIVAKEAHGSMRDALTLLDQAVAFGGGAITVDHLRRFVSAVSSEFVMNFVKHCLAKDSEGLLAAIQELNAEGVKLVSFVEDLCINIRHMFVIKELGSSAVDIEKLGLDEGELKSIAEIAKTAKLLELNRLFRIWAKARHDLSGSEMDRYIVENVALEWCLDPGLPNISELLSGKQPVKSAANPASTQPSTAAPREDTSKPSRNLSAAFDSFSDSSKKKLNESNRPVDSGAKATPKPTQAPSLAEKSAIEQPKETPKVSSWKEVVQLWMRSKPLQAKIFEDTYEVRFSANEIAVAVDATSLAGSRLLQAGTQSSVEKSFGELFGFKGQFRAIPKSEIESQRQIQRPSEEKKEPLKGAVSHPETLREERMREKEEARQEYKEQLRNDPTVKFYLQSTESEIESIELS